MKINTNCPVCNNPLIEKDNPKYSICFPCKYKQFHQTNPNIAHTVEVIELVLQEHYIVAMEYCPKWKRQTTLYYAKPICMINRIKEDLSLNDSIAWANKQIKLLNF